MLISGDSMIAGLSETKLSRNKRWRCHFFQRKNRRFNVSLNTKSKKKSDNVIIHIGTNDGPYKKENVLYEELKKIKDLIITHILTTAWKVSKYGVFSGKNGKNTDQKKLRIWTLFTQWTVRIFGSLARECVPIIKKQITC